MLRVREDDVRKILTVDDTQEAVESAFREYGKGLVQCPPWQVVDVKKPTTSLFRWIASGLAYLKESKVAIVEVATWYPENTPPIWILIYLIEPETGSPLAIIDGSYVMSMRTGGAGAIGAKYLSRKDSRVAGVIGTGSIGTMQLVHLANVRRIRKAFAYSRTAKKRKEYSIEMSNKLGIDVVATDSPEKVVRNADILITATPSREPIVRGEWVNDGTHINAIGSDTPDKRELDPAILKRADKLVIDYEMALQSGEFKIPLQEGRLSLSDVYGNIGEIVAGLKPGRETDSEITIFKSTGMMIQEAACAMKVYAKAKEQGLGKEIEY